MVRHLSRRPLPGSTGAQARAVLRDFASRITVEAAMEAALSRLGKSERDLNREGMTETVAMTIVRSLSIYLKTPKQRLAVRKELMGIAAPKKPTASGLRRTATRRTGARSTVGNTARNRPIPKVRLTIASEMDVVTARRNTRTLAGELGFDRSSTIKVATAVSELARNVFAYVGSGTVEYGPLEGSRVGMRIVVEDQGPGIPNLDDILAGNYRSRTGMGLGILGSRRIMDTFEITSTPGKGTRVVMEKYRY